MPKQAPLGSQTELLGDALDLGNELGAVATPWLPAVILSAAKDLALPHFHEHTSQCSADVNVKSMLRALRFKVAQ